MLKKLIYLCLTIVLFTACGDDPVDPCAGVDCGANGICIDGTCECEEGYSGVNCEIFDLCFMVDCGNNGVCIDGICECNDGYFGDACDSLMQDQFVGTWNGTDCEGDAFSTTIEPGTDILSLIVGDTFFDYNADIIDENNFIMPDQEFEIFEIVFTVNGTGVLLEDGTLEFAATIDVEGEAPESCTIILTKE